MPEPGPVALRRASGAWRPLLRTVEGRPARRPLRTVTPARARPAGRRERAASVLPMLLARLRGRRIVTATQVWIAGRAARPPLTLRTRLVVAPPAPARAAAAAAGAPPPSPPPVPGVVARPAAAPSLMLRSITVLRPGRIERVPAASPDPGSPPPAVPAAGLSGDRGPAGPRGPGGSSMVLRTPGPQARRGDAPDQPPPPEAPAGQPVPASAAGRAAAGPNLDELTEQVIRRIERRATAQRERRTRG